MTTFSIRIELTNLNAARKEYEALGDYLTSLESAYSPEKKAEKTVEKPAPKKATPRKATPKAEVKPKEEKAPEPKQEVAEEVKEVETPSKATITHHDLVGMARDAVKRSDRAKVDGIIKRYGANIPAITANNFEACASELQAVGA